MLPPSCEASESATAVGAERWRKRNCRSYFGLDYTPHVRIDVREVMMGKDDDGNSLDRRVFLGASTATLLGLPGISLAQQQRPSGPDMGSEPATRVPSQAIADFVTGSDLKSAPPIVIERARIAFVDTVGVMLAGSQSSPTDIVCDIIKLEGSAPVATIVGRPLRTSPQLAALANGVAGHAMDFDLSTARWKG
jgi:hypothetical protein